MKKIVAYALIIASLIVSACTQKVVEPIERTPLLSEQITTLRSVIENLTGASLKNYREWNMDLHHLGQRELKALLSKDAWVQATPTGHFESARWVKKVPNSNKAMVIYASYNGPDLRYYVNQHTATDPSYPDRYQDYLSLIFFEPLR